MQPAIKVNAIVRHTIWSRRPVSKIAADFEGAASYEDQGKCPKAPGDGESDEEEEEGENIVGGYGSTTVPINVRHFNRFRLAYG